MKLVISFLLRNTCFLLYLIFYSWFCGNTYKDPTQAQGSDKDRTWALVWWDFMAAPPSPHVEGETKAQRPRASPTASVRPGHRPQPQPWSLHRDLECGLPSSVPQQRTLQARWDPHQQASPHLNWTWGLDGGGQVETRPHWGRRALISLLTLRWEQGTETQEPVETRQRPDGCGLKPRNPGAHTPG